MKRQSTQGDYEKFLNLTDIKPLLDEARKATSRTGNERLLSDPLIDPEEWKEAKLTLDSEQRTNVVVELNIRHNRGLLGAAQGFLLLFRLATGGDPTAGQPTELTKSYMRCKLSELEMHRLAAMVRVTPSDYRPIYHVWPDFPLQALIDKSVATVKADAARRAYDAGGRDIVWAVVDSGIDKYHPHFATYKTLGQEVGKLHRDFTTEGEQHESALVDEYGHGTHVAGIIAGKLPQEAWGDVCVSQRLMAGDELDFSSELEQFEERKVHEPERLAGVAPRCRLISLKVLDEDGHGEASGIMRALQYIRENLNDDPRVLRVHGVNLSLGYPFNAKWFACGQSPICIEVDRLVKSGVVVVVAAGNTGYGPVTTPEGGRRSSALALSINDPGNSDLAITVGATHRDSPHKYGVSYFSSKGPTGDGRSKPDLLAPGERITSCATGKAFKQICPKGEPGFPAYVDRSGTSMAAPHVSGAIAAFLSIRSEFIGRPEEVKRIFMDSATSLGREPYFQGRGVIDLMRAIQSV